VFAEIQTNSLVYEGINGIVQIQAINIGKTPAIITGIWDATLPNQNSISNVDPVVGGLNVTVIPNHYQLIISPKIPAIYISSYPTNYIWGTIYYRDIFGDAHWSQFSYALTDGGKFTWTLPLHTASDDTDPNKTK
jgi:hypothetical protein